MISELTPTIIGALSGFARETLSKFSEWGLRVTHSRLFHAASLLETVANAGTFPTDRDHLERVAVAVRDAEEFVRIGDAIVQPPQGALCRDLQTALRGELGGSSAATREAVQHQTQLYIGALYAHGRWALKVPKPSSEPTPDFEGTIGTLHYGIEIKRPLTEKRPNRLISDAARQVGGDQYHGGAIIVDLSDCLPNKGVWITSGVIPSEDVGVPEFMEISSAIEAEVFNEERLRLERGREHIFTTITIARTFAWDANDPSRLFSIRRARPAFYWRRQRFTLRYHRAHELFELLDAGMREAGHIPIMTFTVAQSRSAGVPPSRFSRS